MWFIRNSVNSIDAINDRDTGKFQAFIYIVYLTSRPFNYNSINTTYFFFFFFQTEKPLFKFPRIKLQGHGKCLFPFLSIRKAVNRKSFREPGLRAQSPIASLLLIIQLWQVANQGNLPDLGAPCYKETEGKGYFRGSLFECWLYCCANKHLLTLLLV